MKNFILTFLSVLQLAGVAAEDGKAGSAKTHRIVFEVVAEGKEAWDAVLNNVENARKALGTDATEVSVIAHGKGLGLLMKESPVRERLEKIAGENVIFAACENTMRKKNVAKEALLPVSRTVDSGVAEVVRKQEAGWAYIKSGG